MLAASGQRFDLPKSTPWKDRLERGPGVFRHSGLVRERSCLYGTLPQWIAVFTDYEVGQRTRDWDNGCTTGGRIVGPEELHSRVTHAQMCTSLVTMAHAT